jgi:NADPH-dependent 7-cyano-7-deazaguanine reductase QueF
MATQKSDMLGIMSGKILFQYVKQKQQKINLKRFEGCFTMLRDHVTVRNQCFTKIYNSAMLLDSVTRKALKIKKNIMSVAGMSIAAVGRYKSHQV